MCHALEVQNKDLYRNMFEDKPREDHFCFAVKKMCSQETSLFSSVPMLRLCPTSSAGTPLSLE